MINPLDMTGKHILVSGASSGIGRETSILLSKLGARLTLLARREEQLKETLCMLDGDGHTYCSFDLSKIDDIEAMIKSLVQSHGAFDGFVHSAGISSYRPLAQMKKVAIEKVMDINYYSFVELIRCITKRNQFNEWLSIVGISSISSIVGNQSKTAYCASKAAMDASIRCMAKELSTKKIRVNSVTPGLVKTEFFETFQDKGTDSEDAKAILRRQYLGVCESTDIANAIAFLLSSASRMITGSTIIVDGGRLSS